MCENGTAMNLMSLINTIKQCDDVKSVITDEGWYITKEGIVTLRSRGCAYKPGYLDVKFANDNYFAAPDDEVLITMIVELIPESDGKILKACNYEFSTGIDLAHTN